MCPRKYTDRKSKSAISVMLNGHIPTAFNWLGRVYKVSAVQDVWRTVGRWWDGDGEKTFFRVLTSSGGVFELYYDDMKDTWSLSRVED